MRFGNDVKTIYVVCVPVSEGRTVVHYKLYRNFMFVHPRDESWVNKVRAGVVVGQCGERVLTVLYVYVVVGGCGETIDDLNNTHHTHTYTHIYIGAGPLLPERHDPDPERGQGDPRVPLPGP